MALLQSISGAGRLVESAQEVVVREERFFKDGAEKVRTTTERITRSVVEWRAATFAACYAYALANKRSFIEYRQDAVGSDSYTLREHHVGTEIISRITTDAPEDEDNTGDY